MKKWKNQGGQSQTEGNPLHPAVNHAEGGFRSHMANAGTPWPVPIDVALHVGGFPPNGTFCCT